MERMTYIPPGGMIGAQQNTQAAQLQLLGSGAPRSRRSRRRSSSRTRSRSPARARRRTRSASSRPRRLVKGSAAAKRYMAMLRRKRRK